jgi:hypothetical protein
LLVWLDGGAETPLGMSDEHKEPTEEQEELEENAELLPDREVMSMIAPPGDPTTPIEPAGGEIATPTEPEYS